MRIISAGPVSIRLKHSLERRGDTGVGNDQIILQKEPKSKDDIIYMFESGYYVQVGCKGFDLLTNM